MKILRTIKFAWLYRKLSETDRQRVSEMIVQSQSETGKQTDGESGKNRSHRASGRLLFEVNGKDGNPRPLHSMHVELWDRDFGRDDILGTGESDREGRFEIWYDPADAGETDKPDLELRVYELSHRYQGTAVEYDKKMIFAVDGDDNVEQQSYEFGDIRVPYWEYDPQAPTPRLMIVENSGPPQSFGPGRMLVMLKQLAPLELKKRKHFVLHKIDSSKPDLQDIQDDYSESLTQRIEREQPGYTRGDEYFGERILNGMSASIMDRDPRNPDLYWIHHHWNSYEQDGHHAQPNVDMWFELRDEKLFPVKIQLHFRHRDDLSANPKMEEPLTFTPDDGDRWLQAKRVARVSAALSAEIDTHLAQTHLNTEQYAVAAYRNFRKSPMRLLMLPHMKEVVLINQEADKWLLGDQGFVTRAAALTAEAWGERVRQTLGTLDWKNWQPRTVICNEHKYAQAAHLFWDVLTDYVDDFFVEHDQEIRRHWHEVHRFSNDLVEHANPYFLCKYLRKALLNDDGDFNPAAHAWFDTNERMDLTIERHQVDGQPIAVQPITNSDVPTEEDLANMKQVARYTIFHATFFHSWPNSRQLDDCGELVYSGLGLRYGDHGVLAPESDLSICPPPDQASEQLWFANALTKTEFGFIMTNEDRDIHPKFASLLREKRSEFADLGINIYRIQSRTNI